MTGKKGEGALPASTNGTARHVRGSNLDGRKGERIVRRGKERKGQRRKKKEGKGRRSSST